MYLSSEEEDKIIAEQDAAAESLATALKMIGYMKAHHLDFWRLTFKGVPGGKRTLLNIAYTIKIRNWTHMLCSYGIHFTIAAMEYFKSIERYEICAEMLAAIELNNTRVAEWQNGHDQYPTTVEGVKGKIFKGFFEDVRRGRQKVQRTKV